MTDTKPSANITNTDIKTIKFTYATLYFGALITLVGTLLYIVACNYFKLNIEPKDVIALFTSGLVSTTLIYTAKNLRLNFEANQAKLLFDSEKFEYDKKAKQEDIKRKIVENSFQISSQWYLPAMAVHVELARSFVRKHADKLQSHVIQDFVTELDTNLEARRALISILNYFETISLLILKGLVDEEVMKDSFKTVFCDYCKVLHYYIQDIQKESSRYLMNYEEISKRWSKI